MKKVTFKIVKTTVRGEDTTLVYRENIHTLLLIPLDPQAGTTYEEMSTIMPILEKFKRANDKSTHILLEDAEHEEVVKRLKNAKFVENTPEIFEMIQSVVNAPEHLIEAVKDG